MRNALITSILCLSQESVYVSIYPVCDVLNGVHLIRETLIQVACGASHSVFLGCDSNVYACGSNFYGQCGMDMCVHMCVWWYACCVLCVK